MRLQVAVRPRPRRGVGALWLRRAHTARLRGALLALAIVAGSFLVYTANGEPLTSFDSAPASLLAFNLLERHRLDLDGFDSGAIAAAGGGYAFTPAADGHLTSVFPIGTAIVALPIYTAFALARHDDAHAPAITAAAFEPQRRWYEKVAAALLAALSVLLFWRCAGAVAAPLPAAIATSTYAFATPMWSIGAQALWQHGPVNLVTLAMIGACIAACRSRDDRHVVLWLGVAGLCAGFLPVIRPTAALFSLAGLGFAGWAFRRRALAFVPALLLGASPGIAWNLYFFHSLAGGYGNDVHAYGTSLPAALGALAALLVSPSRGLFVFAPVLAFAFVGAARAARERDPAARLLCLLGVACVVLAVQYAFYADWWAGIAYGPRFLSDVAAPAALLLVYAIPTGRPRAAAFAVTLAVSIGVQFVGTYGGAAGSDWSTIPVSIDRRPERVWQLADSQIERNARAAFLRLFDWDAARSPAYDRALAAQVTTLALAAPRVAHGTTVTATAVVRNAGGSAIYGYDSGVFLGQLRVRVRVLDARRRTAAEGMLFVRGSPRTGERAPAVGTIAMPRAPGTYTIECVPVTVGGGALAHPGALSVRVTVV